MEALAAAVWQARRSSSSQLIAGDFGLCRRAAVSLSPYGLEHAHKLPSVGDSLPPTPTAQVTRAYATRPAKQQQMANLIGSVHEPL